MQSQLPLYLQTLSLLGITPSSNLQLQQKQNDYLAKDDIKNNNGSAALNLESYTILQNTLQAYNQIQSLANPNQHQELYHFNQELLSRLRNLNVGFPTQTTGPVSTQFTPTPSTSLPNFSADSNFMFTNAATQNFLNSNSNDNSNNNSVNNNIIASSPLGTLNRSSSTYSTISPIGDSFERSLDSINNNISKSNNETTFIRPLSHVGTVTTLDNDGKVKVVVPVEHLRQQNSQQERDRYRVDENYFSDRRSCATLQRPPTQQRALTPILSRGEKKTVTLKVKVTDETGNVTNQRKLPAQPSFITRSTSEKVPNRSQMMSLVQRSQWARHTTK